MHRYNDLNVIEQHLLHCEQPDAVNGCPVGVLSSEWQGAAKEAGFHHDNEPLHSFSHLNDMAIRSNHPCDVTTLSACEEKHGGLFLHAAPKGGVQHVALLEHTTTERI
eukprot:CAMPEP_0172945182 /NCGR_PEP_ID=MMETSP1075-20121228/226423_1 /TAXON_ID=2916 /ORGANISM="Ceratium fusus, Strain PA161109" /LENGTH=107 /DNA_ID=CAMNT_0013806617 /DNA_START=1043 /DNA_END=1366 /DNA_ORIENTATION=+